MANHKSAKKRHRQSLKLNAKNRTVRTRIKNIVKNVQAAVKTQDKEAAQTALTQAMATIDKAATKGVIHWKKAARKISRLHKAVNKAAAA